jgi:hypothetical protein
MAQLLESEEQPRAMLTTGMAMNLNESNIIYLIASGLQKKNCWIKTLSDCNCDYKILKNTVFCSPQK